MEGIKDILRVYNRVRNLDKYHIPENLAKAIAVDAGDLLKNFQWSSDYDLHQVSDNLTHVMIHCITLADKLDLDIKNEIIRTIAESANNSPEFYEEDCGCMDIDTSN